MKRSVLVGLSLVLTSSLAYAAPDAAAEADRALVEALAAVGSAKAAASAVPATPPARRTAEREPSAGCHTAGGESGWLPLALALGTLVWRRRSATSGCPL